VTLRDEAGVAGAVIFEVMPVLLLGPVPGLAADLVPRPADLMTEFDAPSG
jgi:hypothetical protein